MFESGVASVKLGTDIPEAVLERARKIVTKPDKRPPTIYTHTEAAEIVELFEDVLDAHDITVPSPEDDERDAENEARLYGSVYSKLQDAVEQRLIDVIDRANVQGTVVVEGVYS